MMRLDAVFRRTLSLSTCLQAALFVALLALTAAGVRSRVEARRQEDLAAAVESYADEIAKNLILGNRTANELVLLQLQTTHRLNSVQLVERAAADSATATLTCSTSTAHRYCRDSAGFRAVRRALPTDFTSGAAYELVATRDYGAEDPIESAGPLFAGTLVVVAVTCLANVALLARLRRRIGTEVSLLIEATRTVRTGGAPATLRITELAQLERHFARQTQELAVMADVNAKLTAQAAVAKLTAMLAHDVRKPFSILNIGLTQIERLIDDPAGLRTYLPKVKKSLAEVLTQVNTMIADVMDASSDELLLNREQADLVAIARAAAEQAFGFAMPSGITIVEQFGHRNELAVDVSKVMRVLANIIGNAKDAMESGGVITISSRDVGTEVELSVHNTGSFVPAEMRQSLFDSFFTLGKRGGTGLGLAIARKFVEAHGGTIRCESDAESGTTFIFSIASAHLTSSTIRPTVVTASSLRPPNTLPAAPIAASSKTGTFGRNMPAGSS